MIDGDALTGDPAAPLVGPFPQAPFLETWWRHHADGDLQVVRDSTSMASIVVREGMGRFAGDEHLTDYHSPLGPDVAGFSAALLDLDLPLVLDSLPAEVADPLESGLVDAGVRVKRIDGEPCMVLDLEVPGDGGWETMLSSKQRHEVRRKRRRFVDVLGEPDVRQDRASFGRFVDLHRAADGDKGGFMTDAMASFFAALLGLDGARLDVLRDAAGTVVAAAFGFEDDDAYYLYNSAFDQQVSEASPGIVLVDALVQAMSSAGRVRFDFLKGTEAYKRRLGAVERPLVTLEVAR
jgi:CelD/BcsL family acetyltransferase involved in cellulose biosynthesis